MTMINPATLRYTAKRTLVVTRHKGALDWLGRRGVDVSGAKAEITAADVDSDTLIIGNVPFALAARAAAVAVIQFSGDPMRAANYTADDMEKAGAHLALYWVHSKPVIGAWRAGDEIEKAWSGYIQPSEYDLAAERARADGLIEVAHWYEALAQVARGRRVHDTLSAAVTTAAGANILPDTGDLLYWAKMTSPEELSACISEREQEARDWEYSGVDCMAIDERSRAAVLRWAIENELTPAPPSTGSIVVRSGDRVASWPSGRIEDLAAGLRGWWEACKVELPPDVDIRWRRGIDMMVRAIGAQMNKEYALRLDGILQLLCCEIGQLVPNMTLPEVHAEWRAG